MAKLVLERLTRHFSGAERPALDGLSLDIEDGELLVVVGPSGCGKSTALRLVAGLDDPDGGSIILDDRPLDGVAPQDRDIAMVFQGYALYPHMTVAEIMAFPLKMRGVAPADREKAVEKAAAVLGLGKLLSRRPAELSGGERQRVAMGRAIVRDPKLFLFDEPLSNLDAALRTELRVELGRLVRRLGTTSLYVTHDQVEAMTLGDRIAVMKGGTLQQLGTPREVYERPANRFVAGFIGTPAMNMTVAELDAAGDGASLRSGEWSLGSCPASLLPSNPPAKLSLGVRPEHVRTGEAAKNMDVHFVAKVLAAEPLGAETLVYAEHAGTTWVGKASGFVEAQAGAELPLGFAWSNLHWFDGGTGKRLTPSVGPSS